MCEVNYLLGYVMNMVAILKVTILDQSKMLPMEKG